MTALARISRQVSGVAGQWHALSGCRSVRLLNVVSTTPARPSVAKARDTAPSNRVARNPCEKCRLASACRQSVSSRGFTLLELLVALAVFAVMSVMAFGGLRAVLNASESTQASASRLAAVQQAFVVIGRDAEQAQRRPVRDEYGDVQPALRVGSVADRRLFELSRAGWSNPAGHARSTLQRVAYRHEDGTLYRLYWPVLDRAQDSAVQERVLLTGVNAVQVRVLDPDGQWQTDWPPVNGSDAAPRALEMVLELEDWGEVRRLFLIPG
jgi:general secretion pathway protein J